MRRRCVGGDVSEDIDDGDDSGDKESVSERENVSPPVDSRVEYVNAAVVGGGGQQRVALVEGGAAHSLLVELEGLKETREKGRATTKQRASNTQRHGRGAAAGPTQQPRKQAARNTQQQQARPRIIKAREQRHRALKKC